ncbi:MAG: hypothetical protein J6Y88_00055 [Bacteroidales bacterium]|nr:hypothetical protein [Bacteroidales bacterium]
MKRLSVILFLLLSLVGCNSRKSVENSAQELCRHIPDTENLSLSKSYLTADFYALLEEMVSLEDFTPVLHQWEFWFTAADGSPISENACEVLELVKTDETHFTAIIRVHPYDTDYEAEEHSFLMEKAGRKWLLADYDGTKEAAVRYIDIHRKEEELRNNN